MSKDTVDKQQRWDSNPRSQVSEHSVVAIRHQLFEGRRRKQDKEKVKIKVNNMEGKKHKNTK